jgi:alpha-aminoadipate carrier protein LysW
MVNCPVCDAVIDAEEDELDEGDELTCEECGANLTIVGTDPIEIETTEDEDEDDDDEEEDDVDDEDSDDDLEEEDEDEDDDWK